MIEKIRNAGMADMIGAAMKTILSARAGIMPSLKISFSASASDWSAPNGPFQLGPGRCCMRPTTLRSNQIANSVSRSSRTKMITALISINHQGSPASSACVEPSLLTPGPMSDANGARAPRMLISDSALLRR